MGRIAIVDNDQDILHLLEAVFNDDGWSTLPIFDASSAHASIKATQPDVVLLDLWLGTSGDGWALLEALEADRATSDIPIVVCSGDSSELDARGAWVRARDIPVVEKPFDIEEISRVVRETLGTRRQESAD